MARPEELTGSEHGVAEVAAPDLRAVGERIQVLLDASASGGTVARERAEELVRLVADLYGAGLARVLEILSGTGRLDHGLRTALAADDLVASLLVVHGLHPLGVRERVERALESVRPYLGSHGGDVELVDVSAEGVVTLRLLGSCDGCPSSSVTLELAVEEAVEAAAPEVTSIVVQTAASTGHGRTTIPVDALRVRIDPSAPAGAGWTAVPELADLALGEVAGFAVDGLAVLACRAGEQRYAFRDLCPRCGTTLAGATLARLVGGRAEDAALRCPGCRGRFEVRRAGASLEGDGLHLEPLPLLVRDGVWSLVVPVAVG